jgi:hypothetical protein
MITIECKLQPVWRSSVGRKPRLTKRKAYLDAAWQAWKAKHPCMCRSGDGGLIYCREHATVYDPLGDGYHEPIPDPVRRAYRIKAIQRLARWLMWRDERRKEMGR